MIICRPAQCEDGYSRKVGEKTSIQEIAGGTSLPDEDNADPVCLELWAKPSVCILLQRKVRL